MRTHSWYPRYKRQRTNDTSYTKVYKDCNTTALPPASGGETRGVELGALAHACGPTAQEPNWRQTDPNTRREPLVVALCTRRVCSIFSLFPANLQVQSGVQGQREGVSCEVVQFGLGNGFDAWSSPANTAANLPKPRIPTSQVCFQRRLNQYRCIHVRSGGLRKSEHLLLQHRGLEQ